MNNVEIKHSHKKRKDSLETRAILLIFSLEYLGWPYRAYIKTLQNGDFWEELLSEKWVWGYFRHFLLLWPWYQDFWGSSEDRYRSKKVSQMLLVCYNLLNSQNIPTYLAVTYQSTTVKNQWRTQTCFDTVWLVWAPK